MDCTIEDIMLKLSKLETNTVMEKPNSFVNEEEVKIHEDEEKRIDSNENNFKCDQCDFVSQRNNGLKIHKVILQVDGNTSLEEENVNTNTSRYWATGVMGIMFQTYGDVIKEIMESELKEEDKSKKLKL